MENAYEIYKETKLQWVDKIPDHWVEGKVKYLFDIGRGRVISQQELNPNGMYPVYSSQTKNNGCLGFIDTYDFDDDILTWTTDGANAGEVFKRNGKFNCTNVCGTLKPKKDLNLDYFLYLMKFLTPFYKRPDTNGAKIMNGEMAEIISYLPPKQEQTQIASYLDYHTQLIDNLISKKETLIQKLQEQRQAIINEAVTKGLNKNVALTDSGIEYVGNIAENWSNKRVKHSCYVKGRIGWKGLKSDDYLENGYSYLVTGTDFTGQVVDWSKCHFVNQERYEEDPFIQLEEGDLLITKDGTIGKTTLVKNLDKPACLNSGIFLVRSLIPELDINFLYWVLNSNVFKQFIDLTSTGATIKHLYQNVFIEFAYALPPIEEQIEIQKYLFQKFDEFEVSINKVRTSIQKLKNYRQSLISEAVTGKIDVRDWQEPNN